jgi:hypothetical protein
MNGRRRARFLEHAFARARHRLGEVRPHELQRDVRIQREVARHPHRPHAALTEQADERVLLLDDDARRVAVLAQGDQHTRRRDLRGLAGDG